MIKIEPEKIILSKLITDHWIWINERYFKCWIWFHIKANHADAKLLINGRLADINRGQFAITTKQISEFSGMSIQESRHFVYLLAKEGMINKDSNNQTTIITICGYDSYSALQQTNNNPKTNEQQCGIKPNSNKTKIKLTHDIFYKGQIELSKNDQKYSHFVRFLYGSNDTEKELSGVLSIRDQLTFDQFQKILNSCAENGTTIRGILLKIENDERYYKGKKSLYTTMMNWSKERFVK